MWYAVIYGYASASLTAMLPHQAIPREIIGYVGPMKTEMQCLILAPELPRDRAGRIIYGGIVHCEQLSREPPAHRMLNTEKTDGH